MHDDNALHRKSHTLLNCNALGYSNGITLLNVSESSSSHSTICFYPAWQDMATVGSVGNSGGATDDRNSIDIFSRHPTLPHTTTTGYGHCARETSSAKPFIIPRNLTLPVFNTLAILLYTGHCTCYTLIGLFSRGREIPVCYWCEYAHCAHLKWARAVLRESSQRPVGL